MPEQLSNSLRDGLKREPNNSKCHSLLGEIYLQQGQSTIAAKKNLQKSLASPKKAAAAKSSGKSGKKAGSDGGGITICGIKISGGGSKKK
ncbi:MAG: hypothetical protein GDA48_18355 [Hormoscilla sp. GM102CHS1]|nr:hypothetical protein [Hormoscilla sp. GM102CHS1]